MPEQENQQSHFFMGFVIGGVLGALAGILFAPKSGKELRSDIMEKGGEVLKDAKDTYDDAITKTEAVIDDVKHRAGTLKEEADRRLLEARQKAKEILARGEKKEGASSELTETIPGDTKSNCRG